MSDPDQLSREGGQRSEDVERLFDVIAMAIRLGQERSFVKASMVLCNDLAVRFRCTRVALGWLDGPYVRLQAVSHIEKFDRKMAAAQQLESVMEEAFDQDEEILFPPLPGAGQVVRTHEQYARTQGTDHVLSVPIRVGDAPEAVLTAERNGQPFTEAEVWELRLFCDACASRLAVLRDQNRWFLARGWVSLRERLDRLWGVEHSLLKVSGLLFLATLLTLALVNWTYRVEATVSLRANDVIFMPSPFDGYLKEVDVEIGDRVEQGQRVVALDTSELLLEEAMTTADVQRFQREAEKAQAQNLLADMQIALARYRQSLAKLQLVRHHLANAQVKAPLAGIVVEGELKKNLGAPLRKGDLLLKIARLEDAYIEIEIDQVDIHEIAVGSRGEFAFVGRPDLRFPLVIDRIDPVSTQKENKNRFLARGRIESAFASWWRPGMGGTAKIDVGDRSVLWIMTHRTLRFLQKVFWL